MTSRHALAALLLLGLYLPARAATILVRPDGTGDVPTIQAAVDAAADGDAILLADGVYEGPGNRDIVVPDRAFTLASERGQAEYVLIAPGGTLLDPHRAFFVAAGEWVDFTVSDVTIAGGAASAGGACYFSGTAGGRFERIRFAGNSAERGGAIAVTGTASPSFNDCVFRLNTAAVAGGTVSMQDAAGASFSRCLFTEGWVEGSGGAIACEGNANLQVNGCTFSGNGAGERGGALAFASDGIVAVVGTTISGNTAPGGSGASCSGPAHPEFETTLITRGLLGSAIECVGGGTATLACCDLYNNAGGDWIGEIAGQLGAAQNVSLDPQFCSSDPDANSDWTVEFDSPCLPEVSGCAFIIGAWPGNCENSPARQTSWGAIKALYR